MEEELISSQLLTRGPYADNNGSGIRLHSLMYT